MGTLTITLEEKSRTVKIAALGKSTGEKESAIITIIEELSKISYTCSHVGVLDFTYQFNESVPDSEQQQIGGVIRRLKEKKDAEMKQIREDWDAKALAEHLAFERELELDMQRYMAE